MLADALSTSLYIMGRDDAVKYWEANRENFDMVLITERGEIAVTEGISDRFWSEEDYTILRREQTK